MNNNTPITTDETTRKDLESKYGKVWNTTELQTDYKVISFLAPYVMVERRSDSQRGLLQFNHMPRFYFDFMAE